MLCLSNGLWWLLSGVCPYNDYRCIMCDSLTERDSGMYFLVSVLTHAYR